MLQKTVLPRFLTRLLSAGSLLSLVFSVFMNVSNVPHEAVGVQALAAGTGGYYYYADGNRIDLAPSLEWMAVLSGGDELSAQAEILLDSGIVAESLADARTIPYPEMTLIPLAQGLSAASLADGIDALRAASGSAVTVNPVFQTVDAEMVVTDEFIATFPAELSLDAIDTLNTSHGVELVEAILGQENTFVLRVTAGAGMDALSMANLYQEEGLAEDAAPNFVRLLLPQPGASQVRDGVSGMATVNDHYYPDQWALDNIKQYGYWMSLDADIDAPEAWSITMGSASIIIAVIDEGIDLTHEDLAGKLVAGYDATGRGSAGAYSGNDAHGTNVAGLIAAKTNNTIGVAGVCPDCKIMPVRIFYEDSQGHWVTSDSWTANGITWAYEHGASVLNNSWGGGLESTVINRAIANAKVLGRNGMGAVIVFAAGNDNLGAVSYPAYLYNVIAVGASDMCDERKFASADYCNGGELSWGSNYGSALDLLAPGVWLDSTDIMGTAGYTTGNYYQYMNGTSGAAAIVSGVAGLVLSMDNTLTSQQVQTILQNTADDKSGVSGWDADTGYGRVNAFKAVTFQRPAIFDKKTPAEASAGVSTSPTLTWDASIGADSYEYCIDMVEDYQCDTAWISTGAGASVTLSGLSLNSTYYWQVRARNNHGITYANGGSNIWWHFSTTTGAPGSFAKISPSWAAINQTCSPTISWSLSDLAARYEYCVDTLNNNSCDTGWVNNYAATSAALSGLSLNITYYWQTRAVSATGSTTYADGPATNWWPFTVIGSPAAFDKISPTDLHTNDSTMPTLSWGTSSASTGYEYCIDTNDNGACDTGWISTGTHRQVVLPALSFSTTYYWQVRAINGCTPLFANGTQTSWWAFTTHDGSTGPGEFGKISPESGSSNQPLTPTLSWTASREAVRYEFCIDTNPGSTCDATWQNMGTATSVVLPTLSRDKQYFWQVRAVNANGTTYADGMTSYWYFRTIENPPLSFSKTTPLDGDTDQATRPRLSWGSSTWANSYEYCVDTVDNDACDTSWVSQSTTTRYVDLPTLATGTTYYWQVRATNTGGSTYADGGETAWRSFTTQGSDQPASFYKSSPSNAVNHLTTTPNLIWSASSTAGYYEVCIDTSDNNLCDTAWVDAGFATSFLYPALNLNTTYYWQARAVNTSGATYANGATLSWWSFTTTDDIYEPDITSDSAKEITASVIQTHRINPSTDVDYVKFTLTNSSAITLQAQGASFWPNMELYQGSPGSLTLVESSFATSRGLSAALDRVCGVDELPAGTYFVKMTDHQPDTADTPFYTLDFEITQVCNGKPGDFTRFDPPSGSSQSTGVSLSWSPSTGATSYVICYDAIPDNACYNPIYAGNATSVTLTDLNPNTIYYWWVAAANSGGVTYSNGSSATFWTLTTGSAPEVDVKGNQITIPDGNASTSRADLTYFGSAIAPGGTVTRTFTIYNTGNISLILDGTPKVAVSGPNAADFTVTVQPVSSVAPGRSTTFTVVFDTNASGLRTAVLTIVNLDPDERTYEFTIQGRNNEFFLYMPGGTP